jgi:hypothetical protein
MAIVCFIHDVSSNTHTRRHMSIFLVFGLTCIVTIGQREVAQWDQKLRSGASDDVARSSNDSMHIACSYFHSIS